MNAPALQPVIEALGWTLVHFLWQGAVIGVLFALVLRLAAEASSHWRYRAALFMFLGAGLAPLVTFWMVYESAAGPAAPLGGAMLVSAAGPAGAAPWWLALESTLEPYLPWTVALWLAGVIVMSGRVCLDWWQVRRLTWVGVAPLPAHWEERVAELVRTFGVSRPVRVVRSTIVRVPAVIGWLRPVVLLPTAALAGLSARQLELIIAHELAHIRRADYLVNLLQVAIETVLFYHPAVRWMSNRLRQERELCCDDAVIGTCGDTLTYAQALTELEAQRQQSFQTALAASGGQLSQRIYRLLDRPVPRRNTLIWSMSLVVGLAAGSMAVAAQLALTGATAPAPVMEPKPVVPVEATLSDAGPARARTVEPEAASVRESGPAGGKPSATDEPADANPAAVPDSSGTTAGAEPEGEARNAGTTLAAVSTPAEAPATAASREPSPSAAADPPRSAGGDRAGDGQDASRPPAEETPAPDRVADVEPGPGPEPREAAAAPAGRNAASAGARDESAATPDAAGSNEGQGAGSPDEPMRLASATPPRSKASTPPQPVVRGGEPLHVAAPEYPRRARIRGLQGSVTAEFTIGRDGQVRDIQITDSSPAGVFDRSVSDALAEWRFRPLVREGEKVARRVSKQFEFSLADGRGVQANAEDVCDPVTGTRICRPWSSLPGELSTQ